MRKHQYRWLKSVVAAMLLSASGTAFAANWDNGGVGDSWMNPTNWVPDTLPAAGVATYLDNSDTAVLHAGDVGASGPLFVQGTGGGTAQLTIQGTLTTSSYCKLADLAGQSGIVTVDGGTWDVQNYLYVGRNGTGKLVVKNGGTVNQTVSGYGLLISAGGTLELADGTVSTLDLRIDSGGLITIGDGGTILVDGDEAAEINGWVTSGWIAPVNPLSKIIASFSDGVTTVKAVVPDTGYLAPYQDNENTYALWHMDSVSSQTYALDDDSVVVDRDADLTLYPNPNTNGPTLVDPSAMPGLDYPGGNADFGNCLYLDNIQSTATNTAQYLNIPWDDIPLDRTQLRMEGWCKSDVAYDDQILIDRWSQIVVYARDDGFTVLRWDGSNSPAWINVAPAGFTATNWNHFAVEATSSNLLVYVNGFLESDTVLEGGGLYDPSRAATTIGARYNTASAFKGYVDEFRFTFTGVIPDTVEVIDFDADYSTSQGATNQYGYIDATNPVFTNSVDADFDGNVDDQMIGIVFGSDYTPTASEWFTTPAGKSGPGLKYGMSQANIDSALAPVMTLNRFTPTDATYINGLTNDVPGVGRRMATAWYYEKNAFLNGADSLPKLTFANKAGSLKVATNLSGNPSAGTLRGAAFLAQSDGQWYITELTSAGYTSVLSINGATADWYAFDPQSGTLFFDRSDYGTPVAGSALTNITALGIYTQTELTEDNLYHGFKTLNASLAYGEAGSAAEWYESWGSAYPGHDMSLTADPDGDRLDNLSEYALGLDPTVPNANALAMNSAVNGDVFIYVYNRRLDAEDRGLTYTVQRDTDLVSPTLGWTTSGISDAGSGAIDENFEAVTNTIPVAADQEFLRLRIELAE